VLFCDSNTAFVRAFLLN